MKLYLIRHGMTEGNTEKRYIGRTDQPLCALGREQLAKVSYPQCDILICSPMLRCTQSAEVLFPSQEQHIIEGLRECDFGLFEGRNHNDLDGGEYYQRWIDSMGTLPFPEGEDPEAFKNRSTQAFLEGIALAGDCGSAAFVVHDGTIMAVLERLTDDDRHYYSWHVENGRGYLCEYSDGRIEVLKKL